MENIFVARYKQNGINRSVAFNKAAFDEDKARIWLEKNDIQNFFFFFEPDPPTEFDEDTMLFKGDVGFEITVSTLMPYIDNGKKIILDTPGGSLWDAQKIYDTIKIRELNPSIGVIGLCASAGVVVLLSTENRWISENSKGLIHNPWTEAKGDDQELRRVANVLEKEKISVAKICSGASGRPIDEMLELMKKEVILNADEMISYNFAKSKNNKFENSDNSQKPNEDMTENKEANEEIKNEIGAMRKILNSLGKVFAPVKNLIIQDVNGVELDFGDEIETEDQIVVGSTATVDGVAAAGDYTLADGTIYTFEAGAITEITAPEATEDSEEVEALKAENEALKTENADLKGNVENSKKEMETIIAKYSKEIKEVNNKLDALEGKFSGDKPKPNVPSGEDGDTKNKFSFKSKNK